MNIPDIFGSLVFNDQVMRRSLPKDTCSTKKASPLLIFQESKVDIHPQLCYPITCIAGERQITS